MVSNKMMRGSGGSGQGIGEGISTPWLVGRHESGDRGVVQVWHSVLSQSVHLDSESTTDTLPHTTTMSRAAPPRVPCTRFGVSPLAVAKLCMDGVGKKADHKVQTKCIHYMPSSLLSVVAKKDMESLLTPSPMATNVM